MNKRFKITFVIFFGIFSIFTIIGIIAQIKSLVENKDSNIQKINLEKSVKKDVNIIDVNDLQPKLFDAWKNSIKIKIVKMTSTSLFSQDILDNYLLNMKTDIEDTQNYNESLNLTYGFFDKYYYVFEIEYSSNNDLNYKFKSIVFNKEENDGLKINNKNNNQRVKINETKSIALYQPWLVGTGVVSRDNKKGEPTLKFIATDKKTNKEVFTKEFKFIHDLKKESNTDLSIFKKIY